MPRARTHCTWRVLDRDPARTSSLDSELQALVPNESHITRFSWVTVASGNGLDLAEIAKALNRARFTLRDIRPAATEKRR